MNPVPALALALALPPLLSVAIAGCSTKNVPLFGFDKQPDNTLLLNGTASIRIEAVMQVDTPQTFRLRFNGQYGVLELSSGPGPFDYAYVGVQEWVAQTLQYAQVPPGTYVVELVDASGTSWGQSPPIAVQQPAGRQSQSAIIIFVHFDGQAATWVIDPATQDSDPATMETTVSNLSAEDVTVKRCQGAFTAGGDQTCTTLGTAAPGADFHTVETISTATLTPTSTVPALVVGSYQTDLNTVTRGGCEIERIVVTGIRPLPSGFVTSFAMSACNAF